MSKGVKNLALWLIIGLVVIMLIQGMKNVDEKPKKILYSNFLQLVDDGRVTQVTIREKDLAGKYVDEAGKENTFTTYIPIEDPSLLERLYKKNIPYDGDKPKQESSGWMNLILAFGPVALLIGGVWFFMYRQVQGTGNKALSFGKSRATMVKTKPNVTFNDVAGIDEAKHELQEIIEFLKDPKKFQKLGARIPKGVLLVGSPGTGKTLLAKAVAGEAGVPFLNISGSDFVEMFVGVGASRVRDLFEQGKKNAPCIIFVDEIDAVGRMRGAGLGGGHDEREQTLNQLLVEMDGFNTKEGVIMVAATNRPDVLDPALLRPGRFDRQIVVDRPDIKGREGILKVHCKEIPLAPDVELSILARRTPGFVGADLANLVNEAALLAARKNQEAVTMQEFEEAIEKVIAGPERKSRVINDYEKKIVAYHEAGHTLVAKSLPGTDPLHKVSIIPRGHAALGYTLQLPLEDRYLTTRKEILDRITVLLGGRVAEELIFHEITTGAHNDIQRATEAIHKIVCEYGMSDKMGPLTFGSSREMVFLGRDFSRERSYSEEIAFEIDKEVKRIMDECFHMAQKILEEQKDTLIALADALIEREVLEAEEVEMIFKGEKLPALEVTVEPKNENPPDVKNAEKGPELRTDGAGQLPLPGQA